MVQQQMQLISSWLLWEVFADFHFSTILVIVCESVRELDVSKAPADLSSYEVRLMKRNFCFLDGTSQNDPYESKIQSFFTKNKFCWNFVYQNENFQEQTNAK